MSFTKSIFSSELLSTFGWTIIHSVWIGGIVFLLAWMLLYLFRNGKANHRYLIAVGSLFAFLILVTVAFFKVNALQNINYGLNLSIGENFKNLSYNLIEASNLTYLTNNFSLASIENYINQNIPILVVIWLVGLLFFSLRFFGGLLYTYRMRSRSQKIADGELNNVLKQISQKIGLKSTVQIKETSLISSPMVIGFVKPIILLPLGMANGLSLHQVEAILFHEIAHIYRFDYLVNLIQSMVEVVLFYHPVVWWLSAHIRAERENICDDIAIKHTGSALDYAKALTNLQELDKQTPDIVLAFSNKKYRFMNRIRRLLGLPLIENNLVEGLISSLLLIVSVILFTTHAGPVFAQTNDMEILEEESLSNIELPLVNDQDKKTNTKQDSQEAKEYEQRLTKILKDDYQLTQREKEKLAELQKQEDNSNASKSQKDASKKLYELRIKFLTSEQEKIKKCQQVNSTVHDLALKKEKIKKLYKLQQLEHKKFMAKQEELQRVFDGHKYLTNDEQIKLQFEMQILEQYLQKVAQFSEQAGDELKAKQEYLEQMQKEMEKTKPTMEKLQKFEALKKELALKEAKLKDMKMEQQAKLKEMERRMKDKMADMNEVEMKDLQEMEKEMKMKEYQLQNEMKKKEYQMEAEFKKQKYEMQHKMQKIEYEMKTKMEKIEQIRQSGKVEEADQMQQELEKKMQTVQMDIEKKAYAMQVKMEKKAKGMQLEMEKKTHAMQLEMEKKEALMKARLADPEMIKRELSYKKTVDLFTVNLVKDGLKKEGELTEFVLTEKQLTINGKKQSKKFFKKYSQLLVDAKYEKLADGKKFILNF